MESKKHLEFQRLWELFMIQSSPEAMCETVGIIMGQHCAKGRYLDPENSSQIDFLICNQKYYRLNFQLNILQNSTFGFSNLHDYFYLTFFDPMSLYSRVHKSSDSFFSKILEKPSIVQK